MIVTANMPPITPTFTISELTLDQMYVLLALLGACGSSSHSPNKHMYSTVYESVREALGGHHLNNPYKISGIDRILNVVPK